jgi:5-carboxymethyl-2-hydroxymuconate isomerase
MPHLVILYTPNLDPEADMGGLCRTLADAMLAVHDEDGKPVFPTGGVRVLAYPATHFAVADGAADYAFAYLHLRMGRGRSEAVKRRTGEALGEAARRHLEPHMQRRPTGVTLQIDEGPEVFDFKHSTLHPLFTTKS